MSNSFQNENEPAEMTSIATLAEEMAIRLPGCADIEMRKALQSAYADFCRLSCVYTVRHDIEMEDGETEYALTAMTPGAFVDSVTEVRIDRRKLRGGRDYTLTTQGTVVLTLRDSLAYDEPDESAVALRPELVNTKPPMLHVTCVELPKYGSERAPRWFYDKYGQAVVAGALVKLFGMTGKSWTDGTQAQHELIRWENFLTEARIRNIGDERSTSGSGALNALDASVLL